MDTEVACHTDCACYIALLSKNIRNIRGLQNMPVLVSADHSLASPRVIATGKECARPLWRCVPCGGANVPVLHDHVDGNTSCHPQVPQHIRAVRDAGELSTTVKRKE